MKKNGLPDNDEWKNIVDEAFSSDETHVFSENYKMKKQSMRKGIIMKRNNWLMNLTVAAAALAVVAFPTGIYLTTRNAETQPATEVPAEETESTSEGEVTVAESTQEIQAEAVVSDNETEVTLSDGVDDGVVNEETYEYTEEDTDIDYNTIYDVEYGWLPEGLEYQGQDSPYGGKFHNFTTDDGMTPAFAKVPEGVTYIEDTGNPDIETTKDEWLLDGKTVSIYYRSDYIPDNPEYNFGRIAFIYFDNTPYVLQLYVTDGISEEDFKKIIDNVKLVPSDNEVAYYWKPEDEQEGITFSVGSYESLGIPMADSKIVQVGEETYEKNPDVWGNISAKVTGVRFDNNFNGLTNDGIGLVADYNGFLDEDGKLIENVRTWYKNDGTKETLSTETVPVSVMTVSVTYTNNGDTPSDDYCVCPTLQTIYDGYYFRPHIYNLMEASAKLEESMVDYTDTYRYLETDDMHFSFSSPNQTSKNNIHLEPGESAEVTLAYIVEDKFRDNLYLSLNDNGYVELSNLK